MGDLAGADECMVVFGVPGVDANPARCYALFSIRTRTVMLKLNGSYAEVHAINEGMILSPRLKVKLCFDLI